MENIIEVIKKSPIRVNLDNNKIVPFYDVIYKDILEVDNLISSLGDNYNQKLKIVIVGEVKSGKSTLINAILKKDISKVDVLESTSNIIEITYSNIEYNDKQEGIQKIGLDIDYLKNISIVDTPGIKTITKENEYTTLDYIKNADVIFFVIDATHIGQEDIVKELDNIALHCKEIVGIVNKSDLLDDDIGTVMDYIVGEYGIYINDFFIISSKIEYEKNHYEFNEDNNDKVIDKEIRENYKELLAYINELRKKSTNLKKQSLDKTLNILIDKEIKLTNKYIEKLAIFINKLQICEDLLLEKHKEIQDKINIEIDEWIYKSFFKEEVLRMKENIDSAKIYLDDTYINEVVNKRKLELDKIFFNKWIECLEYVDSRVNIEINDILDILQNQDELISKPDINIDNEKFNTKDILATIGTGAILGITSAGVVSAYASTIGTSAATTTITTAMSIYCPPFVIAGTVTCGVGKIIYDAIKTQQRNNDMINDIESFKKELSKSISNQLKLSYENCSKEVLETTKNAYFKSNNVSNDIYDLELIYNESKTYLEKIKDIKI